MNKKLLSCVCAGAMALSLAVPAFASAISNGASVNFQGKPADGEIAVVMQTGGTNLYVNPYGLPYALGYGEVYATAGATTFDKTKDLAIQEPSTATEGFFSDTAVIQNNSDIDLDVKVSMTTTEKGALAFVAAANKVPTAGTLTKQFMYGNLEIATAELTTGTAKVTTTAASGSDPAVKGEVTDAKVVVPDWESKATVAIPAGAAGAAADPLTGTAGKGAASAAADTGITLAAAETTTDSFGTSTTVPGFVAYRLAGTAVPADKDSGSGVPAWAAADVADVNVAFTFTPHVAAAATYNITEGSHTDASSDITSTTFKVSGSAVTSAAAGATVTIEVAATTGKTITASVNGGSAINLSETSGTYTGTFTMPAANATVVLTVA